MINKRFYIYHFQFISNIATGNDMKLASLIGNKIDSKDQATHSFNLTRISLNEKATGYVTYKNVNS